MPHFQPRLLSPILLIIFNRPDITRIVFQAIRKARPAHLLIVADGPRNLEEARKCEQARNIALNVDWDCEVLTNFSDTNLGCKRRVSSGLNWAFSQVERAIILEDDCLPHPTFFRYCEALLDRYASEDQVMHIGGTNLYSQPQLQKSYRFSRLIPCWGWATWRRAWGHYDIEMKTWPKYQHSEDFNYFGVNKNRVYEDFDANYHNLANTWDAQWAFSCVVRQGLSILPKYNLIRNIGFRPDATHTTELYWTAYVPVRGLRLPLEHPAEMIPDQHFDETYLALMYGFLPHQHSLREKIWLRGRRVLMKYFSIDIQPKFPFLP